MDDELAERYSAGNLHLRSGYTGAELPDLKKLVGAKIVNIGFHERRTEGGLTIDWEKDGKTTRSVFNFTELGMWLEWEGAIKA